MHFKSLIFSLSLSLIHYPHSHTQFIFQSFVFFITSKPAFCWLPVCSSSLIQEDISLCLPSFLFPFRAQGLLVLLFSRPLFFSAPATKELLSFLSSLIVLFSFFLFFFLFAFFHSSGLFLHLPP